MLQGYVAKRWGDKMFEKDIAKIVRRRAFWGAVIMALPLFGIEWIVFIIILWSMYSALCEKVGTKLKFSTIAVGFIVNIVVAIAVDMIFTILPILGWLGTGFVVYLQFYFSGKAYIETLKKITFPINDHSKYSDNTFLTPQTSHYDTQNISPEQKALRELETGAIDYAEYEDELKKIKEEEKRAKAAKAYVDESLGKLKELLQAGILSSEEFTRETTRICQENGVSIPSQFIEKSIQDSAQDDSRAGKIIKLMELKDEGKLTEEEYEEQISKL